MPGLLIKRAIGPFHTNTCHFSQYDVMAHWILRNIRRGNHGEFEKTDDVDATETYKD